MLKSLLKATLILVAWALALAGGVYSAKLGLPSWFLVPAIIMLMGTAMFVAHVIKTAPPRDKR